MRLTPQADAPSTTPAARAGRSLAVALAGLVAGWVTVPFAFVLLMPPMQFGQQVEPPPNVVADVLAGLFCAAWPLAALLLAVRLRRVGTVLVAFAVGTTTVAASLGLIG